MKIKGHGPYLAVVSFLLLNIVLSDENADNGLFCSFYVWTGKSLCVSFHLFIVQKYSLLILITRFSMATIKY